MSKKELLKWKDCFSDLSQRPMPWKYFEQVLIKCYGFRKVNKSGSVRTFINEQARVTFTADEPHGREPNVGKYDREKAIKAIESVKALDIDNCKEKK